MRKEEGMDPKRRAAMFGLFSTSIVSTIGAPIIEGLLRYAKQDIKNLNDFNEAWEKYRMDLDKYYNERERIYKERLESEKLAARQKKTGDKKKKGNGTISPIAEPKAPTRPILEENKLARQMYDSFIEINFKDIPQTVIETMIVEIGSTITHNLISNSKFMQAIRLESGNAFETQKIIRMDERGISEEEIEKYLLSNFHTFMNTFMAPLLEEAGLRLLPSLALDFVGIKKEKTMLLGVPIAMIFAIGHGIKIVERDEDGKLKHSTMFHFPALIGGIYYWYLMQKRGFAHAVLAHGLGNNEYNSTKTIRDVYERIKTFKFKI